MNKRLQNGKLITVEEVVKIPSPWKVLYGIYRDEDGIYYYDYDDEGYYIKESSEIDLCGVINELTRNLYEP